MVLVIATAGLIYELVIAAVASYLLGDSVFQFSTIIGVYLSALGLGAYLSGFVERKLALRFIDIELGAALVGGFSAPVLFVAFAHVSSFRVLLYGTVVLVGTLVGLELPLLMRLLSRQVSLKDLVAKSLTFDYAGALLGSLAFSLVLVPMVGLVQTSLFCGLLNAFTGLVSTWLLSNADDDSAEHFGGARIRAVVVIALLLVGLLQGNRFTELSEAAVYDGRVIHAAHSRYQRIVIVDNKGDLRLFLNGNLQFSSRDEHRYHEALVHPAMAAATKRGRIAIGGGGDGLAVREVFKWPDVQSVTLIDLDPAMTDLGRDNPRIRGLNRDALRDPRVTVVNSDAMTWFRESDDTFDVVILDFPDPSNFSLGKLYSRRFYASVRRRLGPGGALVVQSTSPMFARKAFWSVVATIRAAGFHVAPYHVFVPAFGEWGYVLATLDEAPAVGDLPARGLAYLDAATLADAFKFPRDMQQVAVTVNRLNNQALVSYYLDAWSRWD